MKSFFRRFDGATWPQQGRLHVYATGNAELQRVFDTYHQALSGTAEQHGLGLQPGRWAHFTVQMLLRAVAELSADERAILIQSLIAATAELPRLTLQVGASRGASEHAVELAVDSAVDDQWRAMVEAIRAAIADALGPDALPELGPNAVPHTSIGYGVGDGDSGALTSALNKVRLPSVSVPVDELHLVAVTQVPAEGRFTWDTIATLPLRG